MIGCCGGSGEHDSAVSCKFEEIETGFKIVVSSDDPKKAEALKKLAQAKKELCGESCCC